MATASITGDALAPASDVARPASDTLAQAGEVLAPASDAPAEYAGLVTRALGFVIDGLIIQAVSLFVALGTIVVVGVLHLPRQINTLLTAVGAVAYVAWTIGYLVGFWSATGQTPGARVMQVRVTTSEGGRLKPRRALVRCIGLGLAALPLFLGFAPILFDARRRGFQDWLARTVVVRTSQASVAAGRMRPRSS